MNIKHSSKTDQWLTPHDVLDRVRMVLGEIDLDPASSLQANARVGAKRIITAAENALVTPWNCENQSIFVNPPGGKTGNQSNVVLFWQRLLTHRHEFKHAVFMTFSLEVLQTTQKLGHTSIGEMVHCVPAKRIPFVRPDGTRGPSPTHGSLIAYIPGKVDYTGDFVTAFESLGVVI
jgi:hypothetical protein